MRIIGLLRARIVAPSHGAQLRGRERVAGELATPMRRSTEEPPLLLIAFILINGQTGGQSGTGQGRRRLKSTPFYTLLIRTLTPEPGSNAQGASLGDASPAHFPAPLAPCTCPSSESPGTPSSVSFLLLPLRLPHSAYPLHPTHAASPDEPCLLARIGTGDGG